VRALLCGLPRDLSEEAPRALSAAPHGTAPALEFAGRGRGRELNQNSLRNVCGGHASERRIISELARDFGSGAGGAWRCAVLLANQEKRPDANVIELMHDRLRARSFPTRAPLRRTLPGIAGRSSPISKSRDYVAFVDALSRDGDTEASTHRDPCDGGPRGRRTRHDRFARVQGRVARAG
jgi:hypothetical protein